MIKRINIKRFKASFLAALKGWRIRRILAILKNDEKVREAIDIIKLNLDTKIKKGNNLFFKQFIDKYPEMMQLFHSKFEELYQKKGWFEKPITKVKILTNKNVLKSKRFDIQNMRKFKSKEVSSGNQLNSDNHFNTESNKNISKHEDKTKIGIEQKQKIQPKVVQNRNPTPKSKLGKKY